MTPAFKNHRSVSATTTGSAHSHRSQRRLHAVASSSDGLPPPKTGDTEAVPLDEDSPSGPLPSRPLRVVIVEDEAIISMELEMLLEELNAEVVGMAMTAAQAEALVAEHRPDCVTMDINIKGPRDGVSAAQDIFEAYGVRAIFVSAYKDTATVKRAESAKPFGWITKPIDKTDLALALEQVKQQQT